MSAKYSLTKNLVSDTANYRAVVHHTDVVDLDGIVDQIMQRGSTITRPDILAVLEDFHATVEDLVLQGFKVITPTANYGISIRGTFDSQRDGFDPVRHQVVGKVNPGRRLKSAIAMSCHVARTEPDLPRPKPLEYLDIITGELDATLTPGGMGSLIGHRLKYDPADPTQGIFFVDADGNETRVEVVGRNMPGELLFTVPGTLAPGGYLLHVRAPFGADDLRSGTLEAVLTV